MQKWNSALLHTLLCGLAAFAPAVALAQPSCAAGPWRSLFDGKTTQGWRTYGEATLRPQWHVVDGALTLDQPGGGNITFGEVLTGDFEFALDWKVAPAGNSGILYFVDPADETRVPWDSGIEMQLLDNATNQDRFNPVTRAGAMYALYGPSSEVANPAGQWNSARVRVEGANVEQWLNDVRVVATNIESEDFANRVRVSKFASFKNFAKHHSGMIVIQDHLTYDHAAYVQFRNIRIRQLCLPLPEAGPGRSGRKGSVRKH